MKPARFDYVRPRSLEEVLALLQRHGSEGAILAGGQSLMPMLNFRLAQPSILIDINAVPGLDGIAHDRDTLTIGCRARHNDVLRSPVVNKAAPLIVEALTHVAHEAIRNRGTFGGSLALADPAAELPACAIALDATMVAVSQRGERTITAASFFKGMYTTALDADEFLVRVDIPVKDGSWRTGFDEVTRRHGDYALAALALSVRLVEGRITDSRVAFSAVETHTRRLKPVEETLLGITPGMPLDERTIAALRATLEPLDGGEYPPSYRLSLAETLLKRALGRISR